MSATKSYHRPGFAAKVGLAWILLVVALALPGYLILPDDSPNADQQIPEVALREPGFSARILAIRNAEVETMGWVQKMLYGTHSPFIYIPVNRIEWQGDSLIVEKFAGTDGETGARITGTRKAYHVLEVGYRLSANNPEITQNGGKYRFKNDREKWQEVAPSEAKALIQQQIRTRTWWLGADNYGRDLLSRLIIGARVSLGVALLAVLIALTVGIAIGAVAGYFGGKVDDLAMYLMNVVWSIPTILLVFAIVMALGRGVGIIFLAVGLTMWVDVARLVRGQVMSLRRLPFVEAAVSMGFSDARILARHILPNILGPVLVIAASVFSTAILIESGLSFLGFGIQPPMPSWGNILNENYGYAISGKPFVAIFPALAILLTVLAFNLISNGLRDVLDVRE